MVGPFRAMRVLRRMVARKPTFISYNVSNRCNLECPYCAVWRELNDDLAPSEARRILSQLRAEGFEVIEITGGEPLVHKHVYDLLDIVRQLGFSVTLTTNGTALTQKQVERLRGYDNLVQVAVSMDSLDPERFGRLRVKAKLDKVIEGLDRLRSSGPPASFKVNLTLSRENYSEVDDFLRFTAERDIFLSVFPVNLGSGFAHRHEAPELRARSDRDRHAIAQIFLRLAQLKRRGYHLYEFSRFYELAARYVMGEPMGACDAGSLYFDLRSDGKLAVCNDLEHHADLRPEGTSVRQALREHGQQSAINRCYRETPCCYTCSYNLSLMAAYPIEASMEMARSLWTPWRRPEHIPRVFPAAA